MFNKICIILIAGLFIFGISKLSFAMICGDDHGDSQQLAQTHGGHEHGTTETNIKAVSKETINVGNKICPVSGEKIGQGGMEPATYEYEGKIYNFCCPACIEEFKKDPEKYIKKIEAEKANNE